MTVMKKQRSVYHQENGVGKRVTQKMIKVVVQVDKNEVEAVAGVDAEDEVEAVAGVESVDRVEVMDRVEKEEGRVKEGEAEDLEEKIKAKRTRKKGKG